MQVTSVNTDRTQSPIVIGSNYSQEFGIASSAEFFSILSKSLYTNPLLAVIREILCNAWDAHIASNNTNKPIEITVNSNEIIIKDYGFGIEPEKMQPIYCIYGASTKGDDKEQTGGFGLGCKAPFAYTDTFTVESCYKGTQTIYNLAKSNDISMGKPTLNTIASLPTEDTGLKVIIPIRTDDINTIREMVTKIVLFGNIKATLNGVKCRTFKWYPNQFVAITNIRPYGAINHNVFVQYGNVIYPVDPSHLENKESYNLLIAFNQRNSYYDFDNLNFIIKASPNSLDLVPSRETLHYSQKTIITLETLLKNACNYCKECRKYTNEIITNRLKSIYDRSKRSDITNIFNTVHSDFLMSFRHTYDRIADEVKLFITTHPKAISYHILMNRFIYDIGGNSPYFKQLKKKRLLELCKVAYTTNKNINTIFLNQIYRHYTNYAWQKSTYNDVDLNYVNCNYTYENYRNFYKILHRKVDIIAKLVMQVTKKDSITNEIFKKDFRTNYGKYTSISLEILFHKPNTVRETKLSDVFDLIHNDIYLTNSARQIKKEYSQDKGHHFVVCIRNKVQFEKVKNLFLQKNIPFIEKVYETVKKERPVDAVTNKSIPKKQCLYSLKNYSSNLVFNYCSYDKETMYEKTVGQHQLLVTKPSIVLKLNNKTAPDLVNLIVDKGIYNQFAMTFGDETVVVNSETDYQKILKEYPLIEDFEVTFYNWVNNQLLTQKEFIKKSFPYYLANYCFKKLNQITITDKNCYCSNLNNSYVIQGCVRDILENIFKYTFVAKALNLPKFIIDYNDRNRFEHFTEKYYPLYRLVHANDRVNKEWLKIINTQTKIPKKLKKLLRKLLCPIDNSSKGQYRKEFLLNIFAEAAAGYRIREFEDHRKYLDEKDYQDHIILLRVIAQQTLRRNYNE